MGMKERNKVKHRPSNVEKRVYLHDKIQDTITTPLLGDSVISLIPAVKSREQGPSSFKN